MSTALAGEAMAKRCVRGGRRTQDSGYE